MLKAKLLVIGGDAKQAEIKLKTYPTVIGRGRDVTLTLPHPLVSRQHCEIYEKNGRLHIRDLESLNGTYLNNQRIKGEHVFEPGQLLTLGNVTFRADYQVDEPESLPANGDHSTEKTPKSKLSKRKTHHDNSRPDKETVYIDDRKSDDQKQLRNGHDAIQPLSDAPKESPCEAEDLKNVPAAAAGPSESGIYIHDESGDVLFQEPAAISSIDGLPAQLAAASFVGGIVPVDGDTPTPIDMESVQIDLGDGGGTNSASDSSLDAFVNKLPK